MKLEFFVETLEGSRRRKMFPVHFSCVSSVDTPADSIKATFLIFHPKEWMKEIKALELQGDGNRLFHGICDRQIVSLQQDGCRMTVWGRSDAALLLDNEAIPQEYVRVSLDEMFDKHIKPYGFQNELGLTHLFRPGSFPGSIIIKNSIFATKIPLSDHSQIFIAHAFASISF